MAKTQHIALTEICTEGLQTRAVLDMETVREYAEAEAERGAVFPPVTLFFDGSKYWLGDGFHRVAMARQQGKKRVAAEVREGTRDDAVWFACGANKEHGLPRTNADKRRALEIALKMHPEMSNEAIAQHVGVSRVFVINFRKTLSAQVVNRLPPEPRVGVDGKTYPVRLQPPPVRRSVPPERAGNGTDGDKAEGGRMRAEGETDKAEKRLTAPPQTGEGGASTLNAERSTPNAQVSRDSSPPVRRTTPPPVRRNPASGPVDGRGREVPPDLLEIWNRRGEARELAGLVSRVRVALRDAQDGKDPLWSEINFGSALAHLDMAYKEIAAAEPWCVCPMCQGIGCEACRGRGLMGKFRYDNVVPESIKKCASSLVH